MKIGGGVWSSTGSWMCKSSIVLGSRIPASACGRVLTLGKVSLITGVGVCN